MTIQVAIALIEMERALEGLDSQPAGVFQGAAETLIAAVEAAGMCLLGTPSTVAYHVGRGLQDGETRGRVNVAAQVAYLLGVAHAQYGYGATAKLKEAASNVA